MNLISYTDVQKVVNAMIDNFNIPLLNTADGYLIERLVGNIFKEVRNGQLEDRKSEPSDEEITRIAREWSMVKSIITSKPAIECVVIVLNLDNYKNSHSEPLPFKAIVIDRYDQNTIVKSIETGNEYEIYFHQYLEGLDIKEIESMLDMRNYGKSEALNKLSYHGMAEKLGFRCTKGANLWIHKDEKTSFGDEYILTIEGFKKV